MINRLDVDDRKDRFSRTHRLSIIVQRAEGVHSPLVHCRAQQEQSQRAEDLPINPRSNVTTRLNRSRRRSAGSNPSAMARRGRPADADRSSELSLRPKLKADGYDVTYRKYGGGHGLLRHVLHETFEWFLANLSARVRVCLL